MEKRLYSGERIFHDIAAVDPLFSGMFFNDSGQLVMAAQKGADWARLDSIAVDLVRRNAVMSGRPRSPLPAERREMRYSFLQLVAWRHALTSHGLLAIRGVGSLDLSEAANRIVVGVFHDRPDDRPVETEAAVQKLARAKGVPRAALGFERRGRVIVD